MPAYSSELPIRPDLNDTHEELAKRWATTGLWWSGAERLAIVEEVEQRGTRTARSMGISLVQLRDSSQRNTFCLLLR